MAENFDDTEKRLRAQQKLGEDLRKSSAKMAGSMKDYLELQYRLVKSRKVEKDLAAKILKLKEESKGVITDEIKEHEKLLKKIGEENAQLAKGAKLLKSQVLSVKNMSIAVSRDLLKGLKSVSKEIKKQSLEYFEQDKLIRRTAVNVGIMGKQQEKLRSTLYKSALITKRWGVSAAQVGESYGSYLDTVGRLIPLSDKAAIGLAKMGQGTVLGMQGAAEMAASMEVFGLSIERTTGYVEQVANYSEKMGLNSGKVLKTLNTNLKQANTVRFKDGVKGIMKMAAFSTKVRGDMSSILSLAQELWEPERAIELGASLQMMGGAFAKMGDPLKLMYQGRNDPAQLQEDFANAAASVIKFKDGVVDIPSMERHKLKSVAEAMGMDFSQVIEQAETASRQNLIGRMLTPKIKGTDREFIESIAQFGEGTGNKLFVDVDGKAMDITKLSEQNVKDLVKSDKSLKQRAEAAQDFMSRMINFFTSFKSLASIFLQGMEKSLRAPIMALMGGGNEGLMGFADKMKTWGEQFGGWIANGLIPAMEWMKAGIPKFVAAVKGIGEKIGNFFKGDGFQSIKKAGKDIATAIRAIIDFAKTYPKTTAAIMVGAFVGMKLFKAAMWIANGLSLSAGFRLGTRGMMPGGGRGGPGRGGPANMMRHPAGTVIGGKKVGGQMYNAGSKGMSRMAKMGRGMAGGGAMMLGGMAMDYGRTFLDNPDSDFGKALGVGGSTLGMAGTGAMIGSLLGPVGTMVGGIIGGVVGLGKGLYDEFSQDVIGEYDLSSKMKPNKRMGLGGASVASMADGQVAPDGNYILTQKGQWFKSDDKDYITSSVNQPLGGGGGGNISGNMGLSINGTIKLDSNGTTVDASNVMKNPIFISELTRIITKEIKEQNR